MKDRWIYPVAIAFAASLALILYQWTFRPGGNSTASGKAAVTLSTPPASRSATPAPTTVSKPGLSGQTSASLAASLGEQARKALQTGDHDRFIALLIQLVQIDPASAIALAQSSGALREEAMRRVAQYWAEADPDAAEKWASDLPSADERETAVTAVCYQVAQDDPEAAIGIATKHGVGGKGVFPDLAEQWAERDFPAAEEWASRQPDGGEKSQIFARLAMELAKTEPEDAVRLVLKQIPPGPDQSEAAISVLYQWASRDRAGAAAWVADFPPGELKQRAERELTGLAADQDNSSPR